MNTMRNIISMWAAAFTIIISAKTAYAQERTDLPPQVLAGQNTTVDPRLASTNTNPVGLTPPGYVQTFNGGSYNYGNDCMGCPSTNPFYMGYPNYYQNPYYANPYYQTMYSPYSYNNNAYYYNYHPYYSNVLYSYPPTMGNNQQYYYGQQMGNGNYLGVYDQTRNYYTVQRDYYNNPYYAPINSPTTGTTATTSTTSTGTTLSNGTGVSIIQ